MIWAHRQTQIDGVMHLDPQFFSYQKEYAVSESVHLPVAISPPRMRELLQCLAVGNPDMIVHTVSQSLPLVAMQQGCSVIGWDVFGRYYAYIYPIDVHFFLSSRCTLGGKELDSHVALTCRALVCDQAEDVRQQVDWLAGKLTEGIREFAGSVQGADAYLV